MATTPITPLEHKDKDKYTSWNPKETLRKIDEMARHIQDLEARYNALLDMVTKMPTSTSVEVETNKTQEIAGMTSNRRNPTKPIGISMGEKTGG